MKLLAIIAALLVAALPVSAADYYVDATLGLDTNDGSIGAPWQTLAKVHSSRGGYISGDTVHLKRGETWSAKLQVSADYPDNFTLSDYGAGAKPIIDVASAQTYCVDVRNPNTTVSNIHAKNATTACLFSYLVANTTFSGCDTTGGAIGISVNGDSSLDLSSCTVTSSAAGTGYSLVACSGTITSCSATSTSLHGFYATGAGSLAFTSCAATSAGGTSDGYNIASINGTLSLATCTATTNGGNGFYIGPTTAASTITLTGCLADTNAGNGIYLTGLQTSGTSTTLTSCTADSNDGYGFDLKDCSGVTLSGCIATGQTSTEGNGFYAWNTGSDITFDHCEADTNAWDGFSLRNAVTGVEFWHCSSHGNGSADGASGDGFTAHNTSEFAARYCVAYDNLNTAFAITGTGSATIEYCLGWGNGDAGHTRGGFWSDNTAGRLAMTHCSLWGNHPREINLAAATLNVVSFNRNSYFHPADANFASLDGGSTNISWATYSTREPLSAYGAAAPVDAVEHW